MAYKTILLDVDGTLIDNEEGITNAISYALEKMGAPTQDPQRLQRFIGPPLSQSYSEFCHFSPEETLQAIAYHREFYRETGVYQYHVYDGVEEMLQRLQRAGYQICTGSSKPEVFIRQILEHSGLDHYFVDIVGADLAGACDSKEDVCRDALRRTNTKSEEAILVGDRKFDALGAQACNLDFLGVLYGFGDLEELSAYSAKYLAKTPQEVADYLCK